MSVGNYPFDYAPAQSEQQPAPTTVASAATLAALTQRFTRITGTTQITKINPVVDAYHEIVLVFTSAYAALATGGSGSGAIASAYTSIADRPVTLYYDPRTKLYYVQTVA